jgi:gag-polypeptide of LTR copia-type
MTGNNTALSKIIAAVPGHQLHLVKRVRYAKQAWDSLRSVYQPRKSHRASTIKGQIMAYRCLPDMNIATWLNDMQRLYNSLCDLDTESMADRTFALAILNLMPQDDS